MRSIRFRANSAQASSSPQYRSGSSTVKTLPRCTGSPGSSDFEWDVTPPERQVQVADTERQPL